MRSCLILALVLAIIACQTPQSSLPTPRSTAAATGSTAPATGSTSPTTASPAEPSDAEPGGWTWRTGAPVALTEVAAAAHVDEIWVAGGLDAEGRATDRVLIYDPAADTWRDGPTLPEPVHHATLASDGSTLYLVGGYVGDGFDRPTDAVRLIQRPDGGWVDHSPLPEPRAAGGAAWDGSRLVQAGGVGPSGATSTVFVLGGGGWETVGRLSEGREHLGATSDGAGATYVMGGRLGGLQDNRAVVDRVADRSVGRLGDIPTPRGGVAAFWWPGLGACLAGGESPDGTNGQVECIDDQGSLTSLPGLSMPRHGLGAAVVDGVAFVLLGGPEPGLFVSDVVEALVLPG